jgi:hypothetical protein
VTSVIAMVALTEVVAEGEDATPPATKLIEGGKEGEAEGLTLADGDCDGLAEGETEGDPAAACSMTSFGLSAAVVWAAE